MVNGKASMLRNPTSKYMHIGRRMRVESVFGSLQKNRNNFIVLRKLMTLNMDSIINSQVSGKGL
jgi:hypothetical protein